MAERKVAQSVENNPEEAIPKCRTCLNEIPAGARKCVQCDSYQDWRRYLMASNTVLALLVALVSVLTLALPVVQKALHRPDSRVTVQLQNITDEHVFLMVSNPGDRAGSLGTIELRVRGIRPTDIVLPVRVFGWLVGKTLIGPGETSQIDVFPAEHINLTEQEASRLRIAQCQLVINTTEFSGSPRRFMFERPCEEFRKFIFSQRA